MKNVLLVVVFMIIVAAGVYFAFNRTDDPQDIASDTSIPTTTDQAEIPADVLEHVGEKSDMIIVSEPMAMSMVTSPMTFRGEARGGWFFEADFPVMLVNWDGLIIAEGVATATSDWMTEDFVPFEGTLEFEDPSFDQDFSKRGALIFQKNNPSGLSENDDALEIPILFAVFAEQTQ